VIFRTAKDTREDKVAGLSIGGDDYLTKPFGLEELAARIRTVLAPARSQATGYDQPGHGAADAALSVDAIQYAPAKPGCSARLSASCAQAGGWRSPHSR
jgi:DNA-binding response OmpR family regulator